MSGEGIAASMLMAQLYAMFRTLIPFQLSMEYGTSRLEAVASSAAGGPVEDLLQTRIADQMAFRASRPNTDDVPVLALRRL